MILEKVWGREKVGTEERMIGLTMLIVRQRKVFKNSVYVRTNLLYHESIRTKNLECLFSPNIH